VIDHHVDEFVLVRSQIAPLEKSIKRALGRGTVEANQRTDEKPKTALLVDAGDLFWSADASLGKYPLQLGQVSRRKRLISPQLEDGDVIGVSLEELACFGTEPIHISANGNAAYLDLRTGTNLVLDLPSL
jgi:hypothetical protein